MASEPVACSTCTSAPITSRRAQCASIRRPSTDAHSTISSHKQSCPRRCPCLESEDLDPQCRVHTDSQGPDNVPSTLTHRNHLASCACLRLDRHCRSWLPVPSVVEARDHDELASCGGLGRISHVTWYEPDDQNHLDVTAVAFIGTVPAS